MATSTTSFIDAVVPQSLVVALRDDNLTFFKSHEGFTRQQLHGHRVGSAYRSVKSFVTAHRGSDLPDFGDRLHLYANLLWKEMLLYEKTRTAIELKPTGGYRAIRRLFRGIFGVKVPPTQAAIEKALVDGPAEYEVEELAWPADMDMGELRWWEMLDSSLELTVENIRNFENDNSDVPLTELDDDSARGPSPQPPASSRPPQSSPAEPRQLRSAAPAARTVRAPTPRPRLHARGAGGVQPDAERAVLGEGALNQDGVDEDGVGEKESSADADGDQGEDGSDEAPSPRDGRRAPSGALATPEDSDDVPPEIVQQFNKLRRGKQAYHWRAPAGITPQIPLEGRKTVQEIRAAHTDKNGKITSHATLAEVAASPLFSGLRDSGRGKSSACVVSCRPCRLKKLECHYWNRKACTNCYSTKGRCTEARHPGMDADPKIPKNMSPWEPRPERRFWLLKQLEDVMGGWDKRLNAIGEAKGEDDGEDIQSDSKPATRQTKGARKDKSKGKDGKAAKRDDAMNVEPTVTLGKRGGFTPVVFPGPEQDEDASESQEKRSETEADGSEPMAVDEEGVAGPPDPPVDAPKRTSTRRSANTEVRMPSAVDESPSPTERRRLTADSATAENVPPAAGPSRPTKRKNHPARGVSPEGRSPRGLAGMEPTSPTYSPEPVDRPRMMSLPARVPSEAPSQSSSHASHDGAGGGAPPALVARVALLERIVRDDRSIQDARFQTQDARLQTLQAGVLTANTSIQSVHNVAVSADDHARRAETASTRLAVHQEENLKYQRAVLDALAARMGLSTESDGSASSANADMIPSSQVLQKSPDAPGSASHLDVETIIGQAVHKAQLAFGKKNNELWESFKAEAKKNSASLSAQAAQDKAALKDQAARDAAALKEQAARDAEAFRAQVQALEDKLEKRLAALSITPSPGQHSAGVHLAPAPANAGATVGAAASSELSSNNARVLAPSSDSLSAPSSQSEGANAGPGVLPPQDLPGLSNMAAVSRSQRSGDSAGSDIDAIESDEDASLAQGPRKRRASEVEGTNESSDPPHKRHRSASASPKDRGFHAE